MMNRRSFSDKSMATVAVEALRGDMAAQEVAGIDQPTTRFENKSITVARYDQLSCVLM